MQQVSFFLFSKYHLIHPLHKQWLQGQTYAHEKLGVHVGLLQQVLEPCNFFPRAGRKPGYIMSLLQQQLAEEMPGMEIFVTI